LGQAARQAQLLEIAGQPFGEVVALVHAMAPCQWIGTDSTRMAAERRAAARRNSAMQIRDEAVLITGAGRGLGAELARALAKRGARLVLVARDHATVAAVADQIRASGGEAHALAADIGDKQAIHALAG